MLSSSLFFRELYTPLYERRCIKMILFIILLLMLILLTVITVTVISAGGAVLIVLFGDVIVCAGLIIWIMKRLVSKKRK